MDENYLQLYKAWQNFIQFGREDKDVLRPIILRSWKRSAEYGVDPYQQKIRPNKDPNLLKEENRRLVEVSRPFMEMVYNFVKGSNFVVILIDKDGYVLELIGDEETVKAAERNYLIPGANRLEKAVGTNAIGLALAEKTPVQIFGPEHYNYYHHSWTCSAAPIKDPQGKIIGVFDMSGHYSLVHKHTLGMVVSMVRAIERELCLQEAHKEALFVNEHLKAVINSVSDGLLAVDKNGKITHANTIVSRIIGRKRDDIINKHVEKVLEFDRAFKKALISEDICIDKEFYINKGNLKLYCLATTTPIKDQQEEVIGKVIVLREKKKVHNLVHRMVGASASFTFENIIGENKSLKECINLARTVAITDSKVLLEGESGTGKELFAQAIHNYSERKRGPFIAVNCSAIPHELIESELFGYEEGAFTGAKKWGKPGKFELAEGGTLFLDEISSMSLDMQAKLLRVIQENQVVRVGGINVIPLDVRIIAATNRDLSELIKDGSFRDDLYYRLSVVTVKIPPLRERRDDIPVLVEHLSKKLGNKVGAGKVNFTPEALSLLMCYDWPGNIRELENVIERAIILAKGSEINSSFLPEKLKENIGDESKVENKINEKVISLQGEGSLENVEVHVIREALRKTKGNVSKAARILGISRNTIYNKLKKVKENT